MAYKKGKKVETGVWRGAKRVSSPRPSPTTATAKPMLDARDDTTATHGSAMDESRRNLGSRELTATEEPYTKSRRPCGSLPRDGAVFG